MANEVATIPARRSVTIDMATRYGMEPAAFEATVRQICFRTKANEPAATREEFAAGLLVAKEYELNPFTREIYFFRAKSGAIVPVVSVDGWCSLINRQAALDGIEFDDHLDNANLTAITCRLWRKDRAKPIVVTEYMVECRRDIETWNKWPRRMLRHKALIQCARYAFGLSGIVDPDEAERMGADVSPMKDVSPEPPMPPPAEPDLSNPPPNAEGGEQMIPEREPRDQSEVIWEDLPPDLDRNGKWLAEIETRAAACEDLTGIAEIEEEIKKREDLSAKQRTEAKEVLNKHVRRIIGV